MKHLFFLALFASTPLLGCGSCAGCKGSDDDQAGNENGENQKTESYYSNLVSGEESAYFQVPGDWNLTNPEKLDSHIVMHATGKGRREVPPTMNLAIEETNVTLPAYLKVVKEINKADGSRWTELGSLQTESGKASLSQCDRETKWGTTRMLHAILVKDKKAYVLTASALKEEFPDYYELFFNSLRTLHVPQRG